MPLPLQDVYKRQIAVGEKFFDLGLAGGVFGRGLVIRNRDPLADG